MKDKKQIIMPPEDGWEHSTYYVVEIAMNKNNPIFKEIFYTGFLSDGKPSGYNMIQGIQEEIKHVYYMKAIRKIDSKIENSGELVSGAYAEYFV